MLRRRNITILWGQVSTRPPCLGGKPLKMNCVKKGSLHRLMTGPTQVQVLVARAWGSFGPRHRADCCTGKMEEKNYKSRQKLVAAIELVRQGNMFLIERTTSFHSPSGIKNTGDDVEAEEAGLVFLKFRRTLQLIENIAEVRRGRRRGLLH